MTGNDARLVLSIDRSKKTAHYSLQLRKRSALIHLMTVNVIINDGSQGRVTSYTYDALDRLKTITHADGSVIALVWDAGDRVR
jgi:YD repeat-containing protein